MRDKEHELIAAYVPAIHKGYTELFDTQPDATIGVFDTSILSRFDYLRKDIRALTPEIAVQAISGLGRASKLLSHKAISEALQTPEMHITFADDDVSQKILAEQVSILADISLEPIFLRWDRSNTISNQEVVPDRIIKPEDIHSQVIELLASEREGSTNWWRHVSAVIARNATVLSSSHNQTMPTDYTSYIESDPRITAHRGSSIDASLDVHAEAKAIAELAKQGISTLGSEIYVSTFPCPTCAKLIASSGIHRCYFIEGYATLDGQNILKSADVEIVKIDTNDEPNNLHSRLIKYPKSKH